MPPKKAISSRNEVMRKSPPGPMSGEPGIHMDELGPPVLGLHHPLEGYRVVFGSVASLNQDAIAVLNVDPMVGHCAASERLCQSRYSRGVSDARLMVDLNQSSDRDMAVMAQHSSLSTLELPM